MGRDRGAVCLIRCICQRQRTTNSPWPRAALAVFSPPAVKDVFKEVGVTVLVRRSDCQVSGRRREGGGGGERNQHELCASRRNSAFFLFFLRPRARWSAMRGAALPEILFVTVCGTRALGRSPLKTRSPSPGLGSVPRLARHAILHALVHTSPNSRATHAIRKNTRAENASHGAHAGNGGSQRRVCRWGLSEKRKIKRPVSNRHA